MVNDTYRASDIIGGIRDQVMKTPPRMERVDLNPAIEEVMTVVRGESTKHGIAIHKRLAEQLPSVRADRVQLQQVVLNLVLNAIEAIASIESEVRDLFISTETFTHEELLITVGDSGPGIAAENREAIFDPFYTTKATGVGIGLSICRSIIDAHGGRLWAEERLPRGAVLRFTLPAHC